MSKKRSEQQAVEKIFKKEKIIKYEIIRKYTKFFPIKANSPRISIKVWGVTCCSSALDKSVCEEQRQHSRARAAAGVSQPCGWEAPSGAVFSSAADN